MPVHDWTRVDRSLFHDFYLSWVSGLSCRLNGGVLPSAYYALCENLRDGYQPKFLELPEPTRDYKDAGRPGEGRFLFDSPPRTWLQAECVWPEYAEKVISIRRCSDHAVVSAIRIVTEDGKRRPQRFAAFVNWATEVIRDGISLLIVDPFPTDPCGTRDIAKALWNEFVQEDFVLPANKRLTLLAFSSRGENTIYVEPIAVGDVLPDMPLFLKPEFYVPAPLEATYQATWDVFPAALKHLFEPPANKNMP